MNAVIASRRVGLSVVAAAALVVAGLILVLALAGTTSAENGSQHSLTDITVCQGGDCAVVAVTPGDPDPPGEVTEPQLCTGSGISASVHVKASSTGLPGLSGSVILAVTSTGGFEHFASTTLDNSIAEFDLPTLGPCKY